VYLYPEGRLVGKLTGFSAPPAGLCSDISGNVFVTTTDLKQSPIYEYAHGGTTPIATLADPGEARGCSVDPTSGNLAVTNLYAKSGYAPGDIAIFQSASGSPSIYTDEAFKSFIFCAYDNGGNFFADGGLSGAIGELSAGGSSFSNITLTENVVVGSMQWSGDSLVAAGVLSSRGGEWPIYKVTISGSVGQVSGPVLLWSKKDRNPNGDQFWLQGKTIIGPGWRGEHLDFVHFWNYPQGGSPTKTIKKGINNEGVTISLGR
jgi:hypothetical protein